MARKKKIEKIEGVTSRKRGDAIYWYARVNGEKKYCGKGDQGRETAIAARGKAVADKFERRELNAGLDVKRLKLKTFKDFITNCETNENTSVGLYQ